MVETTKSSLKQASCSLTKSITLWVKDKDLIPEADDEEASLVRQTTVFMAKDTPRIFGSKPALLSTLKYPFPPSLMDSIKYNRWCH